MPFQIYTMTVRLSALFEEHITAIIHSWNAASKQRPNHPNTRSSNKPPSNSERSSKKSSDSDESLLKTTLRLRNKRKYKASSSNDSSEEEEEDDEKSNNSSSMSSSSNNSSDSSSDDNKPLQRSSYVNGHKKYGSESESDSDYKPLSSLKRKAPARGNTDRRIVYNESSDSDAQTAANPRTRRVKRQRTILSDSSDSSDDDATGRKSGREGGARNSTLVTVSSRGRVRKLTPKVRAFLEK